MHGWDFSGYSWISEFGYLSESNNSGFEVHFECKFSTFRIQTLIWSCPWACVCVCMYVCVCVCVSTGTAPKTPESTKWSAAVVDPASLTGEFYPAHAQFF